MHYKCKVLFTLSSVISVLFFNTGSIISVQLDSIPATEHDSDSFPGAHFCHTASRGVSGTEAQSPLPAVCLPVLSFLQVS